ncbi:MAG: hypothetical protein A3I44_05195 [Candidatus Sungbacteria bacterium RIFCSPLOWO2_02_FULL_51_17]|uniref:Uncharacterized protein n=1 Tax=Candidatus Sungbacteria bacterium RIFCSPHIGHO2_02_FULL_51_29 TaxID=1802273 RepID=A0A1G2KP61_9BACT|nr:MAG: hypothetical protein A2676_00630 [Candidatus Sungbacteria bacterium RIFCSPHIGHO2_01_FULL_51_22]OHA01163.1 MAG: hypothetical protein A3C16_04565 [Candidatus Sungbacteria bacterium RIFCSPHIGHO2_02_FULL_51_29]OHA08053.1 MAG: hypothetical protein A3B29_03845 [Candidatus Sungbacteria bacterium RIFCSPLOWO2_01_FULL_51_34]OHA11467.1 MAG: hypothetical protein A3I44_05195 [Candidatus Sungbacteria bacterium RIFCSPLOWO2_02_FULL_51_17]
MEEFGATIESAGSLPTPEERMRSRRERIRKEMTRKVGALMFSAWMAVAAGGGPLQAAAGERQRSGSSATEVVKKDRAGRESSLLQVLTNIWNKARGDEPRRGPGPTVRDLGKPSVVRKVEPRGERPTLPKMPEQPATMALEKEKTATLEMQQAEVDMKKMEEALLWTFDKTGSGALLNAYYPAKSAYERRIWTQQEKMGETGAVSYVEFVQGIKKRPEMKKAKSFPALEGLEIAGIHSAEFKSFLMAAYPKSWLGHVRSITYSDVDKPMGVHYLGKNLQNAGTCAEANPKTGTIEFFAGCKDPRLLLQVFTHEMGHIVDWRGNTVMSFEERLQFWQKVLERIEASDRFVSSYVEGVENMSPQKESQIKANEYWAEIMREYFERPPFYWKGGQDPGRLPEKDLELIKWFFARTDPDYDVLNFQNAQADYVSTRISGDTITPPRIFIQKNHKPHG